MKYFKIIFFLVGLSILFANKGWAWDKDVIHPLLNKKAAEQSNLNSYLTTHLNSEFPNGTDQVIKWIAEGGREEDESILPLIGYLTRSSKHFHDPTKSWDMAGWLGASQSSIFWAQSSANEWSWQKTREYYFQALSGVTKTDREKNYGMAFRALGQVMHLVADLAVPEHTRNDTHVIAKTIEGWAQNHSGELNTTAIAVNDSIFQSLLIQGVAPIINLWDTYPSTGYNPNGPIGLAEYSNYNFLSHDTVFKDYEYPGMTNTFLGEPSTRIAEDGTNDNLIYYSGTTTDGISIPHLAFTTYLFSYISQLSQDKYHLKATLDDNCFKDYGSILIPKAVGYSAGLLNYFFRGQINIDKDPNNGSLYVIKNESDEYMSGTWTLYYDDTTDNRRYLTSWNKVINANSSSDSVTFTVPTDAKEKGKYILVFQGTLGNETGAVVGRVVELKKGGIGRVVGVNGNSITVYMEDGSTITGSLPLPPADMTRSRTISVRFDKNDWNIFAVLTIYCNEPDCRNGYYTFHKYSINPDKTLSYQGIVLTMNVFPFFQATKTSEIEYGDYPEYDETFTLTTKVSHFICVDFFMKGGYIKPFGVINTNETVTRMIYQWVLDSGGSLVNAGSLSSYLANDARSTELYYGGVIGTIDIRNCGNNQFDCGEVILENISGESVKYANMYVPGYIYPLAIFNETDYAYIRYYDLYSVRREKQWPPGYWLPWNYNGIYLPWTVDPIISPLPITNSLRLPSNSYIRTILREDDKYSFFQRMDGCGGLSYAPTLAEKVTKCHGVIKAGGFDPYDLNITLDEAVSYIILDRGTYWDANKSYSSETGAMNCQNVLLLNSTFDNEGYYLAWKAGSFVKFKNCSDWKPLEGGGSGVIFDVTLKQ